MKGYAYHPGTWGANVGGLPSLSQKTNTCTKSKQMLQHKTHSFRSCLVFMVTEKLLLGNKEIFIQTNLILVLQVTNIQVCYDNKYM